MKKLSAQLGRARSLRLRWHGSRPLPVPPSRPSNGGKEGEWRVASLRRRRIFAGRDGWEGVVANKEQKRSSREAKKPKQKKKGADKRPPGQPQAKI